MRKPLIAIALVVVLAAALALPALAGTRSVSVKDNFFGPRSLTVRHGTTVRWVWRGFNSHNVTVTRGPVRFHSSTKSSGSFSRLLRRRGTYSIVCTIHRSLGMRMTVRVT